MDERREKLDERSSTCDRQRDSDGDGVRYSPQYCKVAPGQDFKIAALASEL